MKNKPRHNPHKAQNQYGGNFECPNFDSYQNGREFCHQEQGPEIYWWKTDSAGKLECKGNLHTCQKMKRKWIASLSDEERERYFSAMERGVFYGRK